VLFIGAVLTVVSSAGAFMTIKEFRAGADDRRAAQALAYAEAGVDHMELAIKGNYWNYQQIMLSGCPGHTTQTVTGTIGNGAYTTEVRPVTCQDPVPIVRPTDPGRRIEIESTGTQPTATRVVRETALLKPKGLPVGLYARTRVNVGGNAGVTGVSLITPGDIVGRDQLGFTGNDPYYTKRSFYGTSVPDPDAPMPSAAHAGNLIYCQSKCPSSKSQIEHPFVPTPTGASLPYNCLANPRGTAGQSVWDGSNWTPLNPSAANIPGTASCTGVSQFPPTSQFTPEQANLLAPQPELTDEDHRALKTMAQNRGIYCKVTRAPAQTEECTKWTPTGVVPLDSAEVSGIQLGNTEVANLPKQFVIYVDFPGGVGNDPKDFPNSFVKFNGALGSCIDDPVTNVTGVVIVRNGSFRFTSGASLNGAIFANEGLLDSQGTYSFNGVAIADEIEIISGANSTLNECWLKNMPMPFMDLTPLSWTEVDR
jgi:hypothetical protein